MPQLVIFVLTLFLVGNVRCEYSLMGSGASTQSLLWNIFGFVYRGVDPTSQTYYASSSSGSGLIDIKNRSVDFAGSDVMQTEEQLKNFSLYQFPIAAMAIALVYNVPGVDELVLDRQTLVDIFAGRIIYWNHPSIALLNPDATFPNKTITIIYRKGGSGTNQVFTQALVKFDSTFNYSNDPMTWPFAKQGRGIQALESFDISVFVDNTPYALGYVAHPFSNGVPTVTLINRRDQKISPTLHTVQAALQSSPSSPSSSSGIQATYLDSDVDGAYPMVTPTFILYARDTEKDCRFTLALAEMLYWTSSGSLAIEAGTYQDYMQVPEKLSAPYTQMLTLIKCNGKFAYDYLFDYEVILLTVGLLGAFVCLVLVALIILTHKYYASKPWGLIVTFIGHAASYASVYLWIGFPVDWICKSRPFIIFLTFISVVVQLNETIGNVIDAKKYRDKFGNYLPHKISAAMFAINLVIVAAWLGVSPPTENHRRCMGSNQSAFLFGLVGYNIALIAVVFGLNLYALYMEKGTKQGDDSQKTILIAIFAACVYLPINFLKSRTNYNFLGQLLSPATGTIVYSSLQIGIVLIPQIKLSFRALRIKFSANRIRVLAFGPQSFLEPSPSGSNELTPSSSKDSLVC